MKNRSTKFLIWAVSTLCGGLGVVAVTTGEDTPSSPAIRRTPFPKGTTVLMKHMPYEMDEEDCSTCHENVDPLSPGGLLTSVNEGCYECHDDFVKKLGESFAHAPVLDRCTNCHNPHESLEPSLLVEEVGRLCLGCHDDVAATIGTAKVTHGALDTDKKCLNCHNPHNSEVEHLLRALPFDLCVQCHSTSVIVDQEGKHLTNFKSLLEQNEEWHAPVAAKDCSACHQPHGSDHFRLLVQEYPPEFYSPYDPALYSLCFECHDQEMIADAETTTYTQFRDGNRNLHFVHVQKSSRGRTCRACHEVHAAKQSHLIRESVPYGSRGWMLKVNYTRTPTGGSCARTCHNERSYDNTVSLPKTEGN